jgi:hypothetical protein
MKTTGRRDPGSRLGAACGQNVGSCGRRPTSDLARRIATRRLHGVRRPAFGLAVACALVLAAGKPSFAADRYALVVTGASGGAKFAEMYDQWRGRLVKALEERLSFERDHVVVLAEKAGGAVQLATRENVRDALAGLASRMHGTDLLVLVLIGHGTFDGATAKFNLVGPDLDAGEWASLVRGVPGHLVVVNTASASFPFLSALSRKGRVVITATDSVASRFDTVFPEYFTQAVETASTDADRNDRVSIWEIFASASAGVRRYYEEKGLLPVEHPMLDDAGDGFGKDAEQPGIDTSTAQAVYLGPDPAESSLDAATRELIGRRDDLLGEIGQLKAKKPAMDEGDYTARLEKLLIELAKVSRELREKNKT